MRDLSLHILDIVQNSLRARAKNVEIAILEDDHKEVLCLKISDDGVGMDNETLNKVLDPFYTSRKTRKVGLGLPLLAQAAKACGGDFTIDSCPNQGTTVKAKFVKSHIDMLPLGNLADTMVSLIAANPDVDFTFTYKTDRGEFYFDTREVKAQLEDVPITVPMVLDWIKQFVEQGMEKTCGGV